MSPANQDRASDQPDRPGPDDDPGLHGEACDGLLMRTLAAIPEIQPRLRGSQRVAPVHATGNYAYECTRMCGPNRVLVGDAYAFVDPMFSSGVFLGMHGAEKSAAMVDGALRDPAREPALQRALVHWWRRRRATHAGFDSDTMQAGNP